MIDELAAEAGTSIEEIADLR